MKILDNIKISIYILLAKWHWNRFAHYQSLMNKEEMKAHIKKLREELGDST